ncbi:extracellular solute-binding protein [Nonomuraea sp. NPDC005983]|uniref:ABC transporter substrate-binding protein n=1 Tax=Nonomuraea sp. NPDC005983 TaxID=3155595 RepID=UPI0033A4D67F
MTALLTRPVSRRTVLLSTVITGLGIAAASCGTSGTSGAGSTLRVALTGYKSRDTQDATTRRNIKGMTGFLDTTSYKSKASFLDIVADSPTATTSKIQTLLLGGQADVIQGYTVYPFYDQGLLIDLNKYYDKDKWQANFVDSIFKPPAGRVLLPAWSSHPTGKVSSPDSLDTSSVAYDQQLFKDFDVEPLSAQPTIEEILEKAPKLTGKNPRTGKQCYGLYYDPRSSSHLMLVYFAHGLDLGKLDPANPSQLHFDTDEIKTGIQKMVAVAKYCPPGFQIGQGAENWGSKDNTVGINMAVNPRSMIDATLNGQAERYAVTEGIRDRHGATPFVGAGEWAISSKCKDPDAAWELIKFLTGPDGQKYSYQNYGILPAWKNAGFIDAKTSPYADAFLKCATAARNVYFPEFMFRTFRPWMAAIVAQMLAGKNVDLGKELADQQSKAEAWAKEQKAPQG